MKVVVLIAIGSGLVSCGGGGSGGASGGQASENPTAHPSGSGLALLLDVESVEPATDRSARVGDAVPFLLELGPEQDPSAVELEWELDGASIASGSRDITLDTSGLEPGVHVVAARVTQGDETAEVRWRLQLALEPATPRAPSILQALPPRQVRVPQGEAVPFSVLAGDVDSPGTLVHRWSIDGARTEGSGPSVSVDTSSLDVGGHRLTVEVLDGSGKATHEWQLEVLPADDHFQPYLVGAWPRGNLRVLPEGRVRFEVEAAIPNREDVVSYRWEVDGVPQPTAAPYFHFAPSVDQAGGRGLSHRITCRLANGFEEAGESGDEVGWTVHTGPVEPIPASAGINRIPQVGSLFPVGQVNVAPGVSQVFRVTADDPDGDILTYRWIAGGRVQPVDGPVFTHTGAVGAAGQEMKVEVRVDDGRGGASSAASTAAWQIEPLAAPYLALTLPDGSIVLDNGDAGTAPVGNWPASEAGGSFGSTSVYSKVAGNTYTYDFDVEEPGDHEVYLWWTVWPSRASSISVRITHASGTTTRTINQTTGGNQWNSLGTYEFLSSARVMIVAPSGDFSTCADAARLRPVGGSSPPPPPAGGSEIIIDDGASGTSAVGSWSASTAPSPYGARSLYARDSGSYTFQRSISSPATYDVYAWWTEWASRDPAVPYEIVHSGGTATVRRDQRTNGGQWNLLGRYSFGTSVRVLVRATTANTFCADAVRFVPAGTAPPPDDGGSPGDIIVDNGGPGTSSDGSWSASGAPSPYGASSLYAKDRGSYVYQLTLPAAGTYGVYAWYTEWPSRDSAVPYEIQHTGGTAVVRLDQRSGGGRWTPLGDYQLGTSTRVTIRVVDGDTVCADAIRLVPGGGAGAPPTEPTSPPPSSTTPAITEVAAFPLTPTIARVSWRTNYLANSVVSYGTTSSASDTTRTISGSRWEHSVLLQGLTADRLYYVRVRSDGGGVSRTSSVVSFRTPDPTPSYTVASTHPRVFFSQGEIASIRSRLDEAPFDAWWRSVISFSSSQLSRSVTDMRNDQPHYTACVAFAGLIGDIASYRDRAIAVAVAVAGLAASGDNKEMRRRVDFLIPAYDWLFAYLSSSQKTTLRTALSRLAVSLEGRVQETEYADGHSNGDQNGAFLAALAIHGEDSAAAGIVARALVRYNEGFWPFWREHGSENGGSFKSTWYTTVATQFNFEVFAAWKSATGKNLFQIEEAWSRGLADWYLHSFRGDISWHRHGDVIIQEGVDEVERHLLVQIARELRSTDAQWLGGRILDRLGVWGPNMIQDILWYDPSVAERAPTQSTSRHFKGAGMVFTRESWKDDCVQAFFRAPPYYMGGHNHLDQASFAIVYRKGLAINAGVYDEFGSSHGLNYYTRSIAHNTILVTDPSEVFTLYGDNYAADGGQHWLTPARVPYPFPREVTDLTSDDSFHIGGMLAYDDTADYTYAVADGAPAYNPDKLPAFHRHYLWLKSFPGWSHAVVAIFDEVESSSSSFKKTYLLHTQNQPTISGTLVTTTNGTGMLFQRTVFPQSSSIVRVGGSGKEYWVKDRNYVPNRSPKPIEEPGAWRVEVSPGTARIHDEFLHLLYATEAGHSAPPTPRAIDAAGMKGFESGNLVVLFAVKLGSVTTATFTVPASRRCLLFGLQPGRSYDVRLNGSRILTLTSTVSGSLDFNVGSSGTVELIAR